MSEPKKYEVASLIQRGLKQGQIVKANFRWFKNEFETIEAAQEKANELNNMSYARPNSLIKSVAREISLEEPPVWSTFLGRAPSTKGRHQS